MILNNIMFIGFSIAYIVTGNVDNLIVSATFLILLRLDSMGEKLKLSNKSSQVLNKLTDKK